MRTETMLLFGAGGHSKVVLDAVLRSGFDRERLSVVDSDASLHGKEILGIEIGSDDPLVPADRFHVALGDCVTRQRIFEKLLASGWRAASIIHPLASISPYSTIEPGVFVAAGAVVGPAAVVGRGAIVNHCAVVDHDCVVGEFSHIAPNATLGGAVVIGARCLIGSGATILPGIRIEDDAVIGAGAVVLRHIGARETHVGVPAMRVRRS